MSITAQISEIEEPARGVPNAAAAREWCRARGIEDIECVTRDKLMPTENSSAATR